MMGLVAASGSMAAASALLAPTPVTFAAAAPQTLGLSGWQVTWLMVQPKWSLNAYWRRW